MDRSGFLAFYGCYPGVTLRIPDGDLTTHHNFATTYEVLTYEVEQTVYAATIRETAGYQERAAEVGDSVVIQYNPLNPAKSYYAPACRLANRFVVVLVILAGLSAIALAVHAFQRSS
jgi:hypothetical protein